MFDEFGNEKVVVEDATQGTPLKLVSSSDSKVPLYWLDNENFLFAKFKMHFRSGHSIQIVKMNTTSTETDIIMELDSIEPFGCNPESRSNRYGKVIFKSTPLLELPFDIQPSNHQFETNTPVDFSIDKTEKNYVALYKKDSLGTMKRTGYPIRTTEEFIAFEYWTKDDYLSDGVRVWNNITKKWTDLEIYWASSVIGWIEK